MILSTSREDFFHGFDIQALADDGFAFFVFGQRLQKVIGFTFSPSDSGLGIAFGLIDVLGRLSLGFRDNVVPIPVGLVDQLLPFLFGTGHVFKELGHFLRGIDVKQLNGGDLDATLILINDRLQ